MILLYIWKFSPYFLCKLNICELIIIHQSLNIHNTKVFKINFINLALKYLFNFIEQIFYYIIERKLKIIHYFCNLIVKQL